MVYTAVSDSWAAPASSKAKVLSARLPKSVVTAPQLADHTQSDTDGAPVSRLEADEMPTGLPFE